MSLGCHQQRMYKTHNPSITLLHCEQTNMHLAILTKMTIENRFTFALVFRVTLQQGP